MAEKQTPETAPEQEPRLEWVTPEVRRFSAGDAEAIGAIGNDNVIGTS